MEVVLRQVLEYVPQSIIDFLIDSIVLDDGLGDEYHVLYHNIDVPFTQILLAWLDQPFKAY